MLAMMVLVSVGKGQTVVPNKLPSIYSPGDPACTGMQQTATAFISQTLQVSSKMKCTIPALSGFGHYIVSVETYEPLSTILPGQRVFNLTVNGKMRTVDPIRLAQGVNIYYEVTFDVVAYGSITISFESLARTAIWSHIYIRPAEGFTIPSSLVPLPVLNGAPVQ